MSGPERLSDSGPPHLRALIEAGKRDTSSARTQVGVLHALGLGAAGGAALGAAAPSVARAGVRSVLAKSLARLFSFASSKIGVGVIVAVVAGSVAGSAGYVLGRAQERASTRGMRGLGPAEPPAPPGGAPSWTSSTVAQRSSPDAPPDRRPDRDGASPPTPLRADPVAPSVAHGGGFHGAPSSAPESVGSTSTAGAVATPRRETSSARAADPALAGSAHASVERPPRSMEQSPAPPGGAPSLPQAPQASMAAELESIRRAKTLVLKGDGSGALAELDAYEAKTPRRAFEEEDMALRVRALRLLGQRTEAARELAALRARFPGSVYLASFAE